MLTWKSEDNLQLISFFYHVGHRDQTQVSGLSISAITHWAIWLVQLWTFKVLEDNGNFKIWTEVISFYNMAMSHGSKK